MYKTTRSYISDWYDLHKRKLPWRETKSAYHIWVSEIILQQTRVQQGLEYYNRFISRFPKVSDLAQADESEVLLLWQGLGYYSRARNMHFSAKYITEKFNSEFPNEYNKIKELKGVGEYTAAAIASFAFDLPYPAVDGNVMRVISRIFGVEENIMLSQTKKLITQIASEMMDSYKPAHFNQSMMEFGAIQCKASSPVCDSCPVQSMCFAYKNNKVKELPLKINTTKVRNRYFNYLIIRSVSQKQNFLIRKREQKDIWQNLYEFPLIESKKPIDEKEIIEELRTLNICNSNIKLLFHSKEIKHKLSHQLLHIHFNIIECEYDSKQNGFTVIHKNDWDSFPFPEIINKNKELIIKNLSK